MNVNYRLFIAISIAALIAISGRTASAQTVTVIYDAPAEDGGPLLSQVVEELGGLLGSKFSLTVQSSHDDPARAATLIDAAYSDRTVRSVLVFGMLSASIVMRRPSYPKPTIVVGIVDPKLQKAPLTSEGTSGTLNLTYVVPPTNMARDFELLRKIRPYKHLAILGSKRTSESLPFLEAFLRERMGSSTAKLTFVDIDASGNGVDQIPNDADAVYVLPIFEIRDRELRRGIFTAIAARGLPAVALAGRDDVELGAYATTSPATNFEKLIRRTAVNTAQITEGKPAASIPVTVASYRADVVFNMDTIRRTGLYPSYALLAHATLVEVASLPGAETFTLQRAIAEALSNNIELGGIRIGALIANKDIKIARGVLMPNLGGSSNIVAIDKTRTDAAAGAQSRVTWTGSAELSQVIYSEPAWANLTIQKLLAKAKDQEIGDAELIVIRDAARAYINVLLSTNLVTLQNETVAVSKQNLDLASVRREAGQASAADTNRWQSELALGKMDLLDAEASLRASRQALNRVLGRPISSPIAVAPMSFEEVLTTMLEPRIGSLLENAGDAQQFADFMASEINRGAPLLAQVDLSIEAQERLLSSKKRVPWLPQVAAFGNLDYTFGRYGDATMAAFEPDAGPAWTVGVAMSIPVFAIFSQKAEVQKAALTVNRLRADRAVALQGLELQAQSALADASAKFGKIGLGEIAATSARESLTLLQQSYSQGAVNITTVLDAQRATLQAEVLAANTVYQFVLSFLDLERTTGRFHFLATQADRDATFNRFLKFRADRAETAKNL